MKNIFKVLLCSLIVFAGMSSCKKDENQVYFEGGTAPALTASSTTPLTLLLADAAKPVVTFNWTNPGYQFTTGTSSQDVTYTIQVDTVGSNFTNPRKQEFSISKDLSKTFTVNELNDALVSGAKLKLAPNVPHNVEFRVKSSINGNVPLFSNKIAMVITPYPDPNIPTLWITGTAVPSGYTNTPPSSQQFTYITDQKFEMIFAFTPGNEYKLLTKQGQWQPQWGGAPATGGTLSVNPGGGSDPNAIPTPAVAGNYKLTVDLDAKTITVVKQ